MNEDDGVNETRKELAGEYSVLLYQFGEVIKSACCELGWSTLFVTGFGLEGQLDLDEDGMIVLDLLAVSTYGQSKETKAE